MEEVLILILQCISEVLCQVFGSSLWDWLFFWRKEPSSRTSVVIGIFIGIFFFGCFLGWVSLFFIDHTLLPWGWLRMANLIVGPCVSGYVSWLMASWHQKKNPDVHPWFHAGVAAVLCFGFILFRFAFGER
jgi:hypothetical protein